MAIEIGINGYCTPEHVQAHTGDPYPFASDTEPMLDEVQQFITERFGRINAELEAEGYTTPFTLPVNWNILQPINAAGAAADVHESRGDLRASREASEEFLTAIERIKDGDIVLTEESTGSGPSSTDDGFLSSFADNDGELDPADIAGIVREEMRKFLTGFVQQVNYNGNTGILTVTHYLGPTETYQVIPQEIKTPRYWGWSDDNSIDAADLLTADTTEDDTGHLPARDQNGYIFFAAPEARGYPARVRLGGRDATRSFQRQAQQVQDAHGITYIIGISRRQIPPNMAGQPIILEYD